MSATPKARLTPAEYLEIERRSEQRHEYFDGEIFAMPGAEPNHRTITTNLHGLLGEHLKDKQCESYAGERRVFIPASGAYAYPDLFVACGEPQFHDEVSRTMLDPILIVEVLSETTEARDRGTKFRHYRGIYNLEEYILISQLEPRVEKYIRTGDDLWLLSEAVGLEARIWFEIIDCTLSLRDIYDKVDFADE